MAPINASINENSTIQAVIQISQEATREVEQEYTFVTFDLAVAKKAYALIWHDAERYKNVVIHLGVFHTVLSYLGALGKLMKGSGFEDIITEAGLCASGSLDKMMNGKHNNRALRVHTIMLEALERFLFTSFEQNTGSVDVSDKLVVEAKELVTNLGSNAAETTLASQAFDQLFAQHEYFKEEVRAGRHGKTSQFWVQYMNRVWLLLRFLRATKMNDLDLHITCLQQLCPLLFSMDHHNYARYLTVYFISLLNLSDSHPGAESLLRNNGFSVCRSDVPASRTAVNLTIEQTINRHAKTRGGIVGFSRSLPAYYRWSVTRHHRASYVSATHDMADNGDLSNDSHKELTPARKLHSENQVQETIKAFTAFINPFDVQPGNLVCLSSGLKVSEEVASDLLKVEQNDSKLVDLFAKFGTSECITDSDIAELEAFVYTKVDKVRYDTVRQRFKSGSSTPLTNTDGIDLSQMPPCRKVLLLHIQRANFQTQIWRQASKSHPTLPKPEDNGWVIDSSGSLVIQWCEDDFLPKELLDIITEDNCSENEDSIDDEGELSDASSDEIMSSEDEQSDDDF
ncbi:hypothetical protein RRG08_061489 [Elysia crispata]|uniref:Uncharacterized protein n=1 Tax=Elysia crispata TaxID=231223 RepID=A0AAE0YEM2_9GAST|nr:hypothetical protein RRG08_061489 [Elysia crispata]